jgi:hypothetical protein
LTSSTIHPARCSADAVADPGNRESQLRTDSADAQMEAAIAISYPLVEKSPTPRLVAKPA